MGSGSLEPTPKFINLQDADAKRNFAGPYNLWKLHAGLIGEPDPPDPVKFGVIQAITAKRIAAAKRLVAARAVAARAAIECAAAARAAAEYAAAERAAAERAAAEHAAAECAAAERIAAEHAAASSVGPKNYSSNSTFDLDSDDDEIPPEYLGFCAPPTGPVNSLLRRTFGSWTDSGSGLNSQSEDGSSSSESCEAEEYKYSWKLNSLYVRFLGWKLDCEAEAAKQAALEQAIWSAKYDTNYKGYYGGEEDYERRKHARMLNSTYRRFFGGLYVGGKEA